MTMKTVEQIRAMVEEMRASKGSGYAPPADEAIDAAREGRLWAVDTLNAGEDSIVIADSAERALAIVAEGFDPEMAAPAGWTADRVDARRWKRV
jgi:selenocysteine lyase/cysteine desulfurase